MLDVALAKAEDVVGVLVRDWDHLTASASLLEARRARRTLIQRGPTLLKVYKRTKSFFFSFFFFFRQWPNKQ